MENGSLNSGHASDAPPRLPATRRNDCVPHIDLRAIRHPTQEASSKESFVASDKHLPRPMLKVPHYDLLTGTQIQGKIEARLTFPKGKADARENHNSFKSMLFMQLCNDLYQVPFQPHPPCSWPLLKMPSPREILPLQTSLSFMRLQVPRWP